MTLYDLKSCFFFLCYGLLRCQMGAQKLRWLAASAAAGLFQRIFVINAIYCDTGHPWRERPQSSVTLRVLFWSICFFPLGHTVCQRGAPRGSFHHFFFHFSNVTQRIRVPFMQKKKLNSYSGPLLRAFFPSCTRTKPSLATLLWCFSFNNLAAFARLEHRS